MTGELALDPASRSDNAVAAGGARLRIDGGETGRVTPRSVRKSEV